MRLGFYLSCYVASTYWMGERTEQGMWVVEEVPSFFFIVNFISLWTNYYDFTLDLLLDRWTFFFSLGSFVELTTQPPFIIVVSGLISGLRGLQWEGFNGEPRTVGEVWQLNQLSSDPNLYLLQFGFLRFLAAHNVSNIMLTKLQVHSTRVRIVALIIAVTCIFSVIAGAIFFLEARLNGNDTFVNYFDFLYFAVVRRTRLTHLLLMGLARSPLSPCGLAPPSLSSMPLISLLFLARPRFAPPPHAPCR